MAPAVENLTAHGRLVNSQVLALTCPATAVEGFCTADRVAERSLSLSLFHWFSSKLMIEPSLRFPTWSSCLAKFAAQIQRIQNTHKGLVAVNLSSDQDYWEKRTKSNSG